MHRRSVSDLAPGMVIAKDVYSDSGRLLMAAGAALTPSLILSLIERDIVGVHIQDEADDVEFIDSVMEETLSETPAAIARLSQVVAWGARARVSEGVTNSPVTQKARARARAGLPRPVLDRGDVLGALYREVATIIDQVLAPKVISVLDGLKQHSPAVFRHSIDVTIISILIGMHIGLPRPRIRCLALGCLLHDVGKLEIEPAILEKTDRLTPAEMARVKQHPTLGYDIVRGLALSSPLPATVVLQHHERQDGKGYPAGLTGTNAVFRTRAQRLQPGTVTLLAEIAAVADVYSQLVTDSPARPAFPPSQVTSMLRYLSETHLNQEIVEIMLGLTPAFPVGHWVQVIQGKYQGWQGVIERVPLDALMHPIVRLHIDADGRTLPDRIELDLQQQPEARVILLPDDDSAVPDPA